MNPFLEIRGLRKSFPGVVALDGVSLSIERGSCHALIGENGAGKSTVGKILAGVQRADSGEILLDGKAISPATPLEARNLGIAMVHQELAFCPNLTVAENLCLGDQPRHFGFVDRPAMRKRADFMLSAIGAELDPSRAIAELTTGQEQLVQIAAAVGTGAKVIIMDEPTSSLSVRESARLFELIERLRQSGITLIYVSHRMEEIFQVCDAVTILRDGKVAAGGLVADWTPEKVVQAMIGRALENRAPGQVFSGGEEILRVEKLSSAGRFREISFSVQAGEIVGLAGLVGAGRSEVAQAIFGLDPEVSGKISLRGKSLAPASVAAALKEGIGFLPEDRKRLGLVLSMNCRENISLTLLDELSRAGVIDRERERAVAEQFIGRLRIKTPSLETPVAALSGGNQQKVALAKWLSRQCSLLIVDEPTRGVDVGAKAEIHQLISELAASGMAVLLISSELPEVMQLSHRILVLREGSMVGELTQAEFTEERLMRMMAGLESGNSRHLL